MYCASRILRSNVGPVRIVLQARTIETKYHLFLANRYIGDDFWTSAPLTGIGSDVPGLDPTEASSAWDGSCPGTNGATREQLQVVRQVGFYLDQVRSTTVK